MKGKFLKTFQACLMAIALMIATLAQPTSAANGGFSVTSMVGTVSGPVQSHAELVSSEQSIRHLVINHGWVVDGIRVVVASPSGTEQTLPQLGGQGGRATTIDLQPDEYITQISGRYGSYYYQGGSSILSIQIQTNQRTYGPLGFEGPAGYYSNVQNYSLALPAGTEAIDFQLSQGPIYPAAIGLVYRTIQAVSGSTVAEGFQPVTVNVDARQNNQDNPAVQSLPAGTYKVHVLGTTEGGQFDAWNDVDFERGCDGNGQNCDNGWETRYYFKSPYNKVTDSSCRKKKFGSCRYETAAQAAANAPEDVEFTLSTDAEMKFYIYDSRGIEDNQGGLSLTIAQQ